MDKKELTVDKKQSAFIEYLKGAFEELKKVTWPSREDTWRKSWIVIWFSIGFAFFLGALDYVMNEFLTFIV